MDEPLQTTTFRVAGMCCVDEEIVIRRRLESLKGVHDSTFNLITEKLTVRHDCPKETIVNALHASGFTAHTETSATQPESFWKRKRMLLSTSASAFLCVAGIVMQHSDVSAAVTIPVFLGSIVGGGWKIAWRGFQAARSLTFEMNFLMTVATVGAMAIGEWPEASTVIVLFSVALLLESYSLERARKAIRSLISRSPASATTMRGQIEERVEIGRIMIGDILVIRPGEYVPLDGQVVGGNSTVNQAALTGESTPVEKKPGDPVYAGTMNQNGSIEVRVTKLEPDTMLSRIVHLIEEAQAQRAPSHTFVERFASIYTPAVIGLAAVIATVPPLFYAEPFSTWLYRALVLLVAACPCALVISTPLTIVSALTAAMRHGVLIKGGRYVEELAKISAVAFDKTGTLTTGTPRVTDVVPLNSIDPRQIIQLVAAIEAKSEHHLASAFVTRAREDDIPIGGLVRQHFEALTGRGIHAILDGVSYYVGNHRLIEEKSICSSKVEGVIAELEAQGKTAVLLGTEREVLGVVGIADETRGDASGAIKNLRASGIRTIVMLTGDSEAAARNTAATAGVDEVYAGILPDQKVDCVQSLKRKQKVAMVGDGINDAPALAASNVGIAMGKTGTDVALETADVVLMSDDLSKLPYLIGLSKKAVSILKQNIALALVTKMIVLGLGVGGLATLWMAVFADDGAALIVILNSLRLLRFRKSSILPLQPNTRQA